MLFSVQIKTSNYALNQAKTFFAKIFHPQETKRLRITNFYPKSLYREAHVRASGLRTCASLYIHGNTHIIE